jgi:hypothetical protein
MKFRPGAWRERFCLGTVVTVVSAAVCAPVPNRALKGAECRCSNAPEQGAMLKRGFCMWGG